MDQSITRRGRPCWYRVEGVGNIAINDAFMLEGAIYHLLKKHFREELYYVDLLELFHDVRYLLSVRWKRTECDGTGRRRRFRRRWVSWLI